MTTVIASSRLGSIDPSVLHTRPWLIVNPRAGQKLGVKTNLAGAEPVEAALLAAGIEVDVKPTVGPNDGARLAHQAVAAGCDLVIAGGGDGTVAEVAQGLIGTRATLGIMPMGSVMNLARTLCVPRDLAQAAQVISTGRTLEMDVGRVNGHAFLEAGGVGLAAGLFGYFERLDSGRARLLGVARAAVRFVRNIGAPRLLIEADGAQLNRRAAMVTVANGPYVGAAYALAPQAKIDDGLLDVVIFRNMGALRMLAHLALVADGRRLPPPPETHLLRVASVSIATPRRRRRLPVHADVTVVGATPARFDVEPAALRVVIGQSPDDPPSAWTD